MNLGLELKKAENNLKIYQKLVVQAQVKYQKLLNQDQGMFKNHWKAIESARKDLEKLLGGKRHWVKVLSNLEKQIQQRSFLTH